MILAISKKLEKLRALERVNNELRVFEPDFPASYLAAFLYVARKEANGGSNPSATVSEIADNTGIGRPQMSRIILSLSDRRLGGSKAGTKRPAGSRKALGLLRRIPDEHDLRVIRVSLTQKGQALSTRILAHLEGLSE